MLERNSNELDLTNPNLGKTDLENLFETHPQAHTLILTSNPVIFSQEHIVSEYLASNQDLRKLVLKNIRREDLDKEFQSILDAISKHPQLEDISFIGCELECEHVKRLDQVLKKTKIVKLDLSNNNLPAKALNIIGEALGEIQEEGRSLVLDMSGNDLSKDALRIFKVATQGMQITIVHPSVKRNHFEKGLYASQPQGDDDREGDEELAKNPAAADINDVENFEQLLYYTQKIKKPQILDITIIGQAFTLLDKLNGQNVIAELEKSVEVATHLQRSFSDPNLSCRGILICQSILVGMKHGVPIQSLMPFFEKLPWDKEVYNDPKRLKLNLIAKTEVQATLIALNLRLLNDCSLDSIKAMALMFNQLSIYNDKLLKGIVINELFLLGLLEQREQLKQEKSQTNAAKDKISIFDYLITDFMRAICTVSHYGRTNLNGLDPKYPEGVKGSLQRWQMDHDGKNPLNNLKAQRDPNPLFRLGTAKSIKILKKYLGDEWKEIESTFQQKREEKRGEKKTFRS